MTLVMLEEVDVEVDRWADNSEQVGEVGGVLHPGGPQKVLLKLKFSNKNRLRIYELSTEFIE